MSIKQVSFATGLVLASLSLSAQAEKVDFDRWHIKGGVGYVDPKSGNGDLIPGPIDVSSQLGPTATISYFLKPNWAVDLLLGLPFKHELDVNDQSIGSTKHLPPTLSLQYHFNPTGKVRPYAGVGINYTVVFDEELDGPGNLQLKDSVGLAAQLGVDFPLKDKWTVGADVRYIDIDSRASVNGVNIGTVNIDPLVFGINIGRKF